MSIKYNLNCIHHQIQGEIFLAMGEMLTGVTLVKFHQLMALVMYEVLNHFMGDEILIEDKVMDVIVVVHYVLIFLSGESFRD